jgi:hypothetical protein
MIRVFLPDAPALMMTEPKRSENPLQSADQEGQKNGGK